MLIAAVMALGFLLVFLVVYYIPSLAVDGSRVTHMRMGRFVRAVGTAPVSFSARTGKKLVKKAVPNSFPRERMNEQVENLRVRLAALDNHLKQGILSLYPLRDEQSKLLLTQEMRRKNAAHNQEQRCKIELLMSVRASLESINREVQRGNAAKYMEKRFSSALDDLTNLLNLTPARWIKVRETYYGDKFKEAVWDPHASFSDHALTVLLDRVSEVKVALDALGEEISVLAQERRDVDNLRVVKGLQEIRLTSTADREQGVPVLALEEIPQGDRFAFEKARETMNSLPMIESSRVKRILEDSAEAQALARQAGEHGELSFDGRTPEEMVGAILAGNAARLNHTITQAQRGVGSGAADQLRVLEQFTQERVNHME